MASPACANDFETYSTRSEISGAESSTEAVGDELRFGILLSLRQQSELLHRLGPSRIVLKCPDQQLHLRAVDLGGRRFLGATGAVRREHRQRKQQIKIEARRWNNAIR